MRLTVLLTLLDVASAVVLAVTLYALTREEDPDLALLALSCRLTEGVLNAVGAVRSLQLLSVAMASTTGAPGAAAAQAFGALLLQQSGSGFVIGASCFAVGSTIFSYLFLRARRIPIWLAWLGVLSSALLVVALPVQLAGFLSGPVTSYVWIPVALFQVALALWLIIKGVAAPVTR